MSAFNDTLLSYSYLEKKHLKWLQFFLANEWHYSYISFFFRFWRAMNVPTMMKKQPPLRTPTSLSRPPPVFLLLHQAPRTSISLSKTTSPPPKYLYQPTNISNSLLKPAPAAPLAFSHHRYTSHTSSIFPTAPSAFSHNHYTSLTSSIF